MTKTINTVIFDLSEVLIAGLCGVEETLSQRLGRTPRQILDDLGGDLLVQLCQGKISEDEYLASVLKKTGWNISGSELKKAIRANFHRKVAGMEKLLEDLATDYELVLLSDHAREWVQYIHDIHPHLNIFRFRVYSFQIGHTKKHPAAFQRLLQMIQRGPAECVFVDDNLNNVECARNLGMHAFHFTGLTKLLDDLADAPLYHAPKT